MPLAGAAAGASQALEEIVAERILKQKLQQAIAERQQSQALDRDRFEETKRQNDWQRGRTERIDAEALTERTRANDQEATARNGRSDMAGVLAMPGMSVEAKRAEMMGSGLRTGTIDPLKALDGMTAEQDSKEADEILSTLSPDLRTIARLRKVGVTGLSPQDLRSPESVAAAEAAEKAAEFEDWKKKQDYDESQVRSRPKDPKPSGPGGLSTAQGNTALKFQDDYARDSKPYLTMRDAFQRLKSASSAPDAAGDLSMIFAYMKLLDPNSVVREQEFANAQNAAGVPDRIRNAYNNAMKGTRLTPEQRQQFLSQAEGIFAGARQNQQKVRQTYGSRAKQWEIPESMVLDEDDPSAIQRPIPGIAGGIAESTDGGKTWKRIK